MFESFNRDSNEVKKAFDEFNKTGNYTFESKIIKDFNDIYDANINDHETLDTIAKVYEKYDYISDPHTTTSHL